MLPALVEAAAGSIKGSRLTVLNGAHGINDIAIGLAAQGLPMDESLRRSMAEETASIASSGDERQRRPEARPAATGGGAPGA